MTKRKTGFTLAEVLITLAIIGIVAVLTVPSLIIKHQDKVAVAKLKRAYNIFYQAYQMATVEYGGIMLWNLELGQEDMLIDRFAKYMKFNKICYIDELENCIYDGIYKSSTDIDYCNFVAERSEGITRAAGILSDGSTVMLNIRKSWINGWDEWPLQFYIDLNGREKPNKLGDDFFYFFVSSDNKLTPGGGSSKNIADTQNAFAKNCLEANGTSCANWVIEKGNRDYLRCKDLSYSGKSSCD